MSPNQPHDHGPLSAAPPEAWPPLRRLARGVSRPIERFLQIEAASGIVLLIAAATALGWANSPWAASYAALWRTPCAIRIGAFAFERPLHWVVDDGLMVIFFFVVGMEIRRELHHGALSEWRRAALPAAAALGGMLAPAALYLGIAGAASATRSGWGTPMATDIAFAVGILALLGPRVPAALRALLLALAVIDDLGAIVVIALFYSSGIAALGIVLALAGFGGIFLMQRFGVRAKLAYVLPALVAWGGVYHAGIHPTIAGVIVGLVTPVTPWLGRAGFIEAATGEIQQLADADPNQGSSRELAHALRYVDMARREAISPSESLIRSLHPWVAYAIMPLFALSNAGVSVSLGALDHDAWHVVGGVVVGLVFGKPIGVLFASWLTLRTGLGKLPPGLTFRHLVVLGVVAGVGFTMALFIAQLAFTGSRLLSAAKLGVLFASGAAGVIGLALGRQLLRPPASAGASLNAAEAELAQIP